MVDEVLLVVNVRVFEVERCKVDGAVERRTREPFLVMDELGVVADVDSAMEMVGSGDISLTGMVYAVLGDARKKLGLLAEEELVAAERAAEVYEAVKADPSLARPYDEVWEGKTEDLARMEGEDGSDDDGVAGEVGGVDG